MKQLRGVISSLPGMNTARVSVSRQWTHPLYKKSVKRTKNYSCHYEDLKLQVGDEVLIQACRPMSKTKRFLITTVVTTETKS